MFGQYLDENWNNYYRHLNISICSLKHSLDIDILEDILYYFIPEAKNKKTRRKVLLEKEVKR